MCCQSLSFSVNLLTCVALSQLIQNDPGETPLMTASAHGHFSTVVVLLQGGANINKPNKVMLVFLCPWSTVCAHVSENSMLSLEQSSYSICMSIIK